MRSRVALGVGLVLALVGTLAWWSAPSDPKPDPMPSQTVPAGEAHKTFEQPSEPMTAVVTAEPVALNPTTVVACQVDPPFESERVRVIDDALPDLPEPARISNGRLEIFAPRTAGEGVVLVEGYVPAVISWSDGRCRPDPIVLLEGGAAVVGVVRNAEGERAEGVTVHGCGAMSVTGPDGDFYLQGVPGRACTLYAVRTDGLIRVESPEAHVTPVANVDQVVELALPKYTVGGIGVRMVETLHGVEIGPVVPGSPADEAGLQTGMQLLQIDGEEVELLSMFEVVALLRGPVGSEVELVVDAGEGPETMGFERAQID